MGFLMTNYAKSLKLMEPLVPQKSFQTNTLADPKVLDSLRWMMQRSQVTVEDLDGVEIDGRAVKANEARPREEDQEEITSAVSLNSISIKSLLVQEGFFWLVDIN